MIDLESLRILKCFYHSSQPEGLHGQKLRKRPRTRREWFIDEIFHA